MSASSYRTADQPRVADIVTAASRITKLSEEDILGRSRMMHIVRVRNAVCYVARAYGHGYAPIGRALGKDHSTITHACGSAEDLLAEQKMYREVVSEIKAVAARIHASRRISIAA